MSDDAVAFAKASPENCELIDLLFQMFLVRSSPLLLALCVCIVASVCACFCLTFCKKYSSADVNAGAYEAHVGEYEGQCACCGKGVYVEELVALGCPEEHSFHKDCLLNFI